MYSKEIPATVQLVLARKKVSRPVLLGEGGESYVFKYGPSEAIKIYKHGVIDGDKRAYLQNLEQLQRLIASRNLPFATPQILEIGEVDGTYYTIEAKLNGVIMEEKFPTLDTKDQYRLLRSYYESISELNDITLPELPFGDLLDTPRGQIHTASWAAYLSQRFDQKTSSPANKRMRNDVTDFDRKSELFKQIVAKELDVKPEEKSLVHCDYFVNQVLVSGTNEISAILDFGYQSVAGDRRLDAAGVFFFEGMKHYTQAHIEFLQGLTLQQYGETILKFNDIYRLYYCFYYADTYDFWPDWYKILVRNLNNGTIWGRVKNYLAE